MVRWRQGVAAALVLGLVAAGCAAQPGTGEPRRSGGERPAAPKRLIAAVMSEPVVLFNSLGGPIPGRGDVEDLIGAGLSILDNRDGRHPQLAEAVPSVENGLWKVFPDGRMETTWRIRSGAQWHDGAPFTSEDLLFDAQVRRDKDVPELNIDAFRFVDRVEAPDARTISVTWKQPFIDGDSIFDKPLPRHILEREYLQSKSELAQLSFFNTEYVGTGPYKLQQWVRGSHLVVEANDQYVLGRPKIDEIEVKFIPDANTLMANVLAGAVQVTLGRNLGFEQAIEVRAQWREGTVEIAPASALLIYPQFLYTNPVIVREVRFRRALMHAMDRETLVDSVLGGFGSVAHSLHGPLDPPEYQAIEDRIVKYPHDSNRAIQLIQGLGYTRGADGLFRDGSGQKLSVEMRTTGENQIHLKAFYPVINDWQHAGVDVQPVVIPPQRQREREYRATFPALELLRSGNLRGIVNYHTSKQKTPENNWTGSYTGHSNLEYDAIIDRYQATIPIQERVRVVGDALRYMTDQVVVMTLFWDVEPVSFVNRLRGVMGRGIQSNHTWNVHEWTLS